ncbi:MAG: hypothetical protein V4760_03320 [Bdellovibrionota bacterium]
MTTNDNWLLLTDYASKYRISVSTLRRRIKSDQIKYKLDHGRYLIFDEAPAHHDAHDHAPTMTRFAAEAAPLAAPLAARMASPMESQIRELAEKGAEEPATRLLNELKRAYTSVLQEKEEQLIQLKEEVSDLKTLVRVLESDNDRMRRHLQSWNQE